MPADCPDAPPGVNGPVRIPWPATATPAVPQILPPPPPVDRVRTDGKFFRLGPDPLTDQFTVKGVTYGPFEPAGDGVPLPSPEQVDRDFRQLTDLHANVVRVYHTPPAWFLDAAQAHGIKLLVDVAWPKNLSFDRDAGIAATAHAAVRAAAVACGNHPAVFALSVVNEFPPDLARYIGRRRVERFIDGLVRTSRAAAPHCLVTFANFPTTEYLSPAEIDFHCFNVYLHDDRTFGDYLARLQRVVAGGKPLILGEYGVDTGREQSEEGQAAVLAAHVRAAFDEGLAGTVVFGFTDDWFTNGYRVDDWRFGLTRADRTPKPAFAAVAAAFAAAPRTIFDRDLPRVTIVVCTHNGAATIGPCLSSLQRLNYPQYDVIVVDDGSADDAPAVVARYPAVRYVRQPHLGLSAARNAGLALATGDVVAYTDDDCEADPDWLYHLATVLARGRYAAVGGPNLTPAGDGPVADCVALAPGGPAHVLLDDRTADHVPGCNLAVWTDVARSVGGFDPRFRRAGDDVDFTWRLRDAGHAVGFAPAAQVWHHRRRTVAAYLRQQRGYGHAEAMLAAKHGPRATGSLYAGPSGRDVVYHGPFGTALFQTLYRRPASVSVAVMMSVEWHAMTAVVAVLGLVVRPLLAVAAGMFAAPVVLAIAAAARSPLPRRSRWFTRPLIGYLHFRQPIARGWARHTARVSPARFDVAPRPGPLPIDPNDRRALRYWSKVQDRFPLLHELLAALSAHGLPARVDRRWGGWDVEVDASRLVRLRLTTATELHETGDDAGRLTRVRLHAAMTPLCRRLLAVTLTACGVLLVGRLWPYSAAVAVLPLAVVTGFLGSRRRAREAVLRLTDEAAERSGYWPVEG